MISVILFVLSIGLQLSAGVSALFLIRTTGRNLAWILISLAMLLIGWRRMVTVAAMFSAGKAITFEFPEYIALLVSLLMLAGVLQIGAYFRSIRTADEERRKAEDHLNNLAQRLQLATSAANLGVWDWDVVNGTMVWDDRMLELYGHTGQTFPGGVEAWQNGLHPADRDATIELCQAALRGEKEWDTTFRVLHSDGTVKHIKADGLVIRNPVGAPVRMLGVNVDITDHVRADRAVKNAAQEWRESFDAINDIITIHDKDFNIVRANKAAESGFGMAMSDILSTKCFRSYHGTDCPPTGCPSCETLKSGIPSTVELFEPHLNKFVEIKALPRFSADRTIVGVVHVVRDITEGKRAENEQRKNEFYLRRAQELGRIGHFSFDPVSNTVEGSPELYRIFDVDLDQPLFKAFSEAVYPEDGHLIFPFIDRAVKEGIPYDVEHRVRHRNGTILQVQAKGEIVVTLEGRRMVGIVQDITERKQTEIKLQEKNTELERFTYTISHDLKSPLVTIKTFLGYLEQDLAGNDAVRAATDIDYIRSASDKMVLLLNELLEMSRVGSVVNNPVRVAFRELVDEASATVAGKLIENKVTVQVGETDSMLYGDRQRLCEIWQNLMENSVKYMGDQKAPRIEMGTELQDGMPVYFVRDNGMGIDPSYKDKIFGLFEKLDPKSEGSGLGLALVKRIVELYKGRIWLESEGAGKGSCFKFTLPEAVKGN